MERCSVNYIAPFLEISVVYCLNMLLVGSLDITLSFELALMPSRCIRLFFLT